MSSIELKYFVLDELKKFSRKDLKISKAAAKMIARFVFKAVEDLIERADEYRSERLAEESPPEEEESVSSEVEEPLKIDDIIQAFRDLEDRYQLTDRDTESLFSRLDRSMKRIRRNLDTPVTIDIARILLRSGISTRSWEESVEQFISIYIKLLTRELLGESVALLDPQSKRITEDNAKSAVNSRRS